MATVYLARTGKSGGQGFEKLVALKAIHSHLADQPAFVNMFLDECQIASAIDHPNVCSVLDFGQEQGIYYLAMEFLLGESLSQIARAIARRRDPDELVSLPWYVSRVIADACEGLHAAHELQDSRGTPLRVVHRDVSPENIVVTYDGAVKIVDFGVAKAAQRIHETQVAKIKGKFAYVSPEQVHNQELDRRTDIWGLGVCLWESLTLKRLFRRDSDAATLSAVLFADIPPPSTVRRWVPPRLDKIVMRALSREPSERFPDARSLGLALREFLTQTGATIGIAETGDWMQRLFEAERERRLAMVHRARQGLETGPFVTEKGENSGCTMPSISVRISQEEIEQIEGLAGRAPEMARPSQRPPAPDARESGPAPTMAPPARASNEALPTVEDAPPKKMESQRKDQPTRRTRRTSLPDDDVLLRGMRGGRRLLWSAVALVAVAATIMLVPSSRQWVISLVNPPPEPVIEVTPPPLPSVGDVRIQVDPEGAEVWLFVGRSPVSIEASETPTLMTFNPAGEMNRWTGSVESDEPGEDSESALRVSVEGDAYTASTSATGSKIWRLIGTGPRTQLEGSELEATLEFLATMDGSEPARAFVAPDDWSRDEQGTPSAEVTIRVDVQ